MDGEAEYFSLLRQALWTVDHHDPAVLHVGLSFFWSLRRDEVIEAMAARADQLEAAIAQLDHEVRQLEETRMLPAHVAEAYRLGIARCRGEAGFVTEFAGRLRSGYYQLADDGGAIQRPGAGRWPGPFDRCPPQPGATAR